MTLAKPKTGLTIFENTAKTKPKVSGYFPRKLYKSLNFEPTPWVRPFLHTGPGFAVNLSPTICNNLKI